MKNISKIIILFFLFISSAVAGDIYLNLRSTDISLDARHQFVLLQNFDIKNKPTITYAPQIMSLINDNLNLCTELKTQFNKTTFLKIDPTLLNSIDYLIEGTIDYKNNVITVKLQYLTKGETVLMKDYKLTELTDAAFAKVTNKISDDIYFNILGEKSYFSTQFAFSYEETNKEIYTIDFNGKNLKKITENNSISILPAWHPKKKALIYTSYKNGNPDLFFTDLITNTTKTISDKQGLNISANYSPNAENIALTVTHHGNSNIVLLNKDGNFLAQVTDNNWINSSSCWSNTGDKILFISNQTGITQIYSKNLTNEETTQLTFDKTFKDSIDYSPVADEIIYACMIDKKWDICRLDLKTKNIYKLTENQGSNEDPSYSFDGRYIAFTSTKNAKRELFIMDKNGNNVHLIASLKGPISSPRWSPSYE